MPVYVYRCEQCGSEFEKRQSFSDAPLTECEECRGTLRKVLTPAVVIFKGSGFYSTDNNGKSGSNGRNGSQEKNDNPAGKSDTTNSPEAKSESKSDTKETAKAGSTKED